MKKNAVLSFFGIIALGIVMVGNVFAATNTFTTNLSFGMTANPNVMALQEFLTAQGIFSGSITGNFFILTEQAVKEFQILNNIIPSSGYFGPLTRAKANEIIASATITATSTPAAASSTESVAQTSNLLAYMQSEFNGILNTFRNLNQHNSGRIASGTPTASATTRPQAPTPTSLPAPSSTPKIISTPTSSITVATATTISTVSTAQTSTLSWGVYSGDSPDTLASFSNLVGKSPNIEAIFLSMGVDSFPTNYTQSVGQAGKTLLIFWEPDNGSDNINQPNFNYSSILNGQYDTSIKQFAAAAKAYGYPVILVPMDEMNGNWEPWGGTVNGNTPAQFAQVWIHIHNLFAGISNVKFGWDVNNQSVPDTSANAISAYWPGSQYVDYVGVDGFNGNGDPWQSFSQVFPMSLMNQLASYGKPIYIFSMGSTESASSPTAKAQWITQGLGPNGLISTFPDLAGWVWFNENGGDATSDWLINSDVSSLAAFRAALL